MDCYNHPSEGAVAQCTDCGKGLCLGCSKKFMPILCDECLLVRAAECRNDLIKNTILMLALFIVGLAVYAQEPSLNIGQKILGGYLFAGIPYGWSSLTRITPTMFLSLSWMGWLIYFTTKFVLSILIGMFITPFRIFKMIKEYKNIVEVAGAAA